MSDEGTPADLRLRSSGAGSLQVFISHGHTESKLAAEIAEALRPAGFVVLDAFTDITAGQNIMAAITSAISEADICLFLVGDKPSTSWIETEQSLAVGRSLTEGRPRVLPVIVGHNTELPFFLQSFQALRLDDPSDASKLIPALTRLSETEPDVSAETAVLKESTRLQRLSIEQEALAYELIKARRTETLGRYGMLAGFVVALALLAVTILLIVEFHTGWASSLAAGASGAGLSATVTAYYSATRLRRHEAELRREMSLTDFDDQDAK